ncbi:methionine--tRNA ligase [Paracoccaceae bacterium]|nr:methionine--tRNA ligase [Paracoccaceae bacterium]
MKLKKSDNEMKRILITSALPYINGIKHLGNLVGSQLPADLYARFMRAKGHEVAFICATDEHGTPAELAAIEGKTSTEDYCGKMWQTQKDLSAQFFLSFDFFGRSSSPSNHALTKAFALNLDDNGLLKSVEERQLYSEKDKRFLPDRYVIGTCPDCSYERARGDQCENCTRQLNASELIKPSSVLSGSRDLKLIETKHLYLMQSKLKEKLLTWIESNDHWPILTTSIAKKWLMDGDGLQDRSITRDLSWGIPVEKNGKPWKGLENKVFYVWFDAPIAYISATIDWAKSKKKNPDFWKSWWLNDHGAEDVHYVQFMAKDNIPFHTLSFPATLIGSGQSWKLVDYIKGFNWLTYDGGKFSTSQKRGVFMNQALDLFPSDYWRWWLLSNAPETSDADFTWRSFQSSINKDLADVLGNFVSRLTKFTFSKFGPTIPNGSRYGEEELNAIREIEKVFASYDNAMNKIEIRKATSYLRKIWSIGNEYLQRSQPWVKIKTDTAEAAKIIRFGFNLMLFFSEISEPFIPSTSNEIKYCLGKLNEKSQWPSLKEDFTSIFEKIDYGDDFKQIENLFVKISDGYALDLAERFSGTN